MWQWGQWGTMWLAAELSLSLFSFVSFTTLNGSIQQKKKTPSGELITGHCVLGSSIILQLTGATIFIFSQWQRSATTEQPDGSTQSAIRPGDNRVTIKENEKFKNYYKVGYEIHHVTCWIIVDMGH